MAPDVIEVRADGCVRDFGVRFSECGLALYLASVGRAKDGYFSLERGRPGYG